ncbi:MAG TPA: outer membrane lipoprotein carrier protein LolA [Myxococcota bacterium]|nr:outer membrane lipoprotein carrier protein LolA [Myxococcota bacterium]
MKARAAWVALFAWAALAAEPAPPHGGDLTLDDLLTHMRSTHGVLAEFHEVKTLRLLESPLESKGTVYFLPPDRFARVTTEPAETRLVLDGGRMRFQDAAGGSDVDLSANPVARAFADNLMVLWRGDRAALEEIYALDFHSQGARWDMGLTPRHAPLDRFLRSITLHGDGAQMHEIDVLESDGDRTQTLFDRVDVDHAFGEDEARAVFGAGAAK